MRGVYTAEYDTAISGAKTLMLLEVPSDMALEILGASITNQDVDTSEQLEGGLFRVDTLGSASGTDVTPEKHETGDAASTVTAYANLSTEPSAYDSLGYDHQGFNNLAGYRYDPIPEERPIISPSGAVGLRLLTAPSAAHTLSMQIVYREIGG